MSTNMNMEPHNLPFNDARPLERPTIETYMETIGDCVEMHLKNSPEALKSHKQKMLRMAKCPFLFGVIDNLPRPWIKVLTKFGLLEAGREKNTNTMTETEMATYEMVDMISERCLQLTENKNDLRSIMMLIYEVEERSNYGKNIDMTYALTEIVKLEMFTSMWAPLKRSYEKKKKQAHVAFVYFFKIVHDHLIFYGRDGTDKEMFVQERVLKRRAKEQASPSKEFLSQGSKAYNEGNYASAYELYSNGIRLDPFNVSLYGNRAQSSIHLGEYWRGLCDCKRAIAINPSQAKNYYRAARCYMRFGQMDRAADMNYLCLQHNTDTNLKKDILSQTTEIEEVAKNGLTNGTNGATTNGVLNKDIDVQRNKTSAQPDSQPHQLKYNQLLCEGLAAYNGGYHQRALDHFQGALKMVMDKTVREAPIGVTILQYVCGKTSKETGTYRNILSAIAAFQGIIKETTFPAALYGLGSAFVCLKRYKEALDPVETCIKKVKGKKGEDFGPYLWPQSDQSIKETKPVELKRLLKELYQECRWPPKPDAMCMIHCDTEIPHREIYMSDPDYKGHVLVVCFDRCCMALHASCWKFFKTKLGEKVKDKDMIDATCPTPNCWEVIQGIYIFKPDWDKPVLLRSQLEGTSKAAPAKPRAKLRTDNPDKIKKKMERKRVKKQKKEEARLAKAASEESPVHIIEEVLDEDPVLVKLGGQFVELKKDDDVLLQSKPAKPVKSKKKKEKSKQVLQVDFGFVGDDGKELYSAKSMDDEGDFVTSAADIRVPSYPIGQLPAPAPFPTSSEPFPTTTPPPAANPFPLSNGLLTPPVSHSGLLDQQVETLYQYFRQVLRSTGPLELEGEEIAEALSRISADDQGRIFLFGGLANFLKARINFLVIENHYVCVFEDHGKARKLMEKKMQSKGFSWEQRAKEMEEKRLATEHDVLLAHGHLIGRGLNPAAKEFKSLFNQSDDAANYPNLAAANSGASAKSDKIDKKALEDGFITVSRKKTLKSTISTNRQESIAQVISSTPDSFSKVTAGTPPKEGKSGGSMMELDDFLDVKMTTKKKNSITDKYPTLEEISGAAFSKESNSNMMGLDDFDDLLPHRKYSEEQERSEDEGTSGMDSIDGIDCEDLNPMPSTHSLARLVEANKSRQTPIPSSHSSSPATLFGTRKNSDSNSISSTEELRRSSSPASSLSGSAHFPKPLKSTGVTLPTRGKKALRGGLRGTRPTSLGQQRAPSSSGSLGSGLNGEEEDRDSQISDRGSEGSEAPGSHKPFNFNSTISAPNPLTLPNSRTKPQGLFTPVSTGMYPSNGMGLTLSNATAALASINHGMLAANSKHSEPPGFGNSRKSESPGFVNSRNSSSPGLGVLGNVFGGNSSVFASSQQSNISDPFNKPDQNNKFAGLSSIWGASPSLDSSSGPFGDDNNSVNSPFGESKRTVEQSSNPFGDSNGASSSPFGSVGQAFGSSETEKTKASSGGLSHMIAPLSPSYNPFSPSSSIYASTPLENNFSNSMNFAFNNGLGPGGRNKTDVNQPLQQQQQNSGSKLAQFFGSTINSCPLPKTLPVPSPDTSSDKDSSSHNPEAFSTNTFPSMGDFAQGIFLPNDLLSSSIAMATPHQSRTPPTSSGEPDTTSSSYYSLSPSSSKSGLATTTGSLLTSASSSGADTTSQVAYHDPERIAWLASHPLPPAFVPASSSSLAMMTQSSSSSASLSLVSALHNVTAAVFSAEDKECQVFPECASATTNTPLTFPEVEKLYSSQEILSEQLKVTQKENMQLQARLEDYQKLMVSLEVSFKDQTETLTQVHQEIIRLKADMDEMNIVNTELADQIVDSKREVELSSQLEAETDRAKLAECQTLGFRYQLIANKLDMALREGAGRFSQLSSVISQCKSRGQPVSAEHSTMITEWQAHISKLHQIKTEMGVSYKAQLEELEKGTRLENLEQLSFNPPPAPTMGNPSPPSSNGSDSGRSELATKMANSLPTRGEEKTPSAFAGPPGLKIPGTGLGLSSAHSNGLRGASVLSSLASKSSSPIKKTPTLVHPPGLRSPSLPLTRSSLRMPKAPIPKGLLGAPNKQQNSFDRMVTCVQQRFSHYTKQDIMKIIEEMRRASGGSLAGVEFSELVNKVVEKIQERADAGILSGSGLSSVSGVSSVSGASEMGDTCSICTDDIHSDLKELECGHVFHGKCIKQWFNRQATCPNCRVYSLLPEEFPTLK